MGDALATLVGVVGLLWVVAFIGAITFAIMRRWRLLAISGATILGLTLVAFAAALLDASEKPSKVAHATRRADTPTPVDTPKATPATPTRTPRPTPVPTPSPVPKNIDYANLAKFRENWTDIVRRTAVAVKAHDAARKYLLAGDAIDGSIELKKCEDAASGINDDAYSLPVQSSEDADSALLESVRKIGDGLGYGCKALRKFVDTNAPSDAADAKTQFAEVMHGIYESEIRAQEKYASMGGNPRSLLDFKTAVR